MINFYCTLCAYGIKPQHKMDEEKILNNAILLISSLFQNKLPLFHYITTLDSMEALKGFSSIRKNSQLFPGTVAVIPGSVYGIVI